MLYVNFLANYLPLNGKNTGTLSDQYPNLFVPAALTFSIWGVIYILLIIFVVYNIIKAFKDADFINRRLDILIDFVITCILNIAWVFAWHYEKIVLCVIIMILFLLTLLSIFVSQKKLQKTEKLSILYTVPIDFYLGWISVASIANITALLVFYGFSGFGISASIWTAIMIIIGGILGLIMLFKYDSIAYSIVIIWAYIGIIIKRSSLTPVYQDIIIAASVMIVLQLIAIIRSILMLNRKLKKSNA